MAATALTQLHFHKGISFSVISVNKHGMCREAAACKHQLTKVFE